MHFLEVQQMLIISPVTCNKYYSRCLLFLHAASVRARSHACAPQQPFRGVVTPVRPPLHLAWFHGNLCAA